MYDFKTYEYGQASKGTMFIFGGWRMHRLAYRVGIKKINKAGFKCVLYEPSARLLRSGTTPAEIVTAAEKGVELVKQYIKNDTNPNAKYMALGVSLGTMSAVKAAKECQQIKAVILLSPFGDVDEHMQLWLQHRYFGKVARSWQTSPRESVDILNKGSTLSDLKRLEGKTVMVGYGRNDTLIHTHIIEGFVKQLRKHKINLITKNVRGNHFIAMYKLSLWFQPKNLDFFK